MPGLQARFGYGVAWLDLEGSFVWLTRTSPELDRSFLGSHFGAYFMLAPLRLHRTLLRVGVGGDFYPLWNIHEEEWQRALSVRASVHQPLAKRLNVFGTARAYALHSDGLELGRTRTGEHGLPVLFSLGLEWRVSP